MDVDKYLQKIKYNGPKEISIDVLKELHFLHITNVPFDTLNMFGGRRKVLDLKVIYDNIINYNRGGLCYELNGVFHWLLTSLGFKVDMLNGIGFNERKDEFSSEFDHMVLMVTFSEDDKWIVDVGWGGNSFEYPVKFENMLEHTERSGIYRPRLMQDDQGECYALEKRRQIYLNNNDLNQIAGTPSKEPPTESKWQKQDWQLIFKFRKQIYHLHDFEQACEDIQNGQRGLLKEHWFLLRHTENGRMVLCDNIYFEREYVDPLTLRKTCKIILDEISIKDLIKEKFDINLDFYPAK